MSMRAVIESIEREMFDRTIKTEKNCGNCKWWADNEVCCNGDADKVGDFTDKDFLCGCHELRENEFETL